MTERSVASLTDSPVLQLSELSDPGAREFQHRGQACFGVLYQGKLHLYRNRCPHRQVALNWQPEQFFDHSGALLQCASHGALFLIETGECVAGPCQGEFLENLPFVLRGDDIYLC